MIAQSTAVPVFHLAHVSTSDNSIFVIYQTQDRITTYNFSVSNTRNFSLFPNLWSFLINNQYNTGNNLKLFKGDSHFISINFKKLSFIETWNLTNKFWHNAKKLEGNFESNESFYLIPVCVLIWMFCNKSSNTQINHLHKRALRIAYNDNDSTFEDLLKKDNSVTIHHKNIRLLGIELWKVKNTLSSHVMSEIFNLRNIDYNLHSQIDLK